MKNLIIIIFFFLSNLTVLNSQSLEIPKTQNPLIIKVTATWCTNCGSWGWVFFHDLIEDNDDKAVIFAAHHSGDLKNSTASAIVKNFDLSGQPIFLLNGEDQYVGSGSTSSKRTLFATKVDENIAKSPMVQTGIEAVYNDKTMTVNYSSKFFNSSSGEYTLGIYLVEKIVTAYQASQGNNAKHKKILRTELSGNTFGTPLASGSIEIDKTISGSIEFNISSYDVKNLEIILIIWKKEGNKYSIINSNIDEEISLNGTSSIKDDLISSTKFTAYPTIIKDNTNITIEFTNRISNPIIYMYDSNGKLILKTNSANLNFGANTIHFDVPANIANGIYYLNLNSLKNRTAKKIIIER